MAWIKNIEHPDNGAVATFWELIGVVYDHRAQTSVLTVGGWVSQEAYASKEPLMVKRWEIPSGLAPELAAGAVAFVSGYAKQQSEFVGATDVPA